MGLNLNGTSQYLQAAWSPGAVQPMSVMAWVRKNTTAEMSVISAGDVDGDLAFNNLQLRSGDTRAISFLPYAEAQGAIVPINTVTFVLAVFTGTTLIIYVGDNAPVSQAWSPQGSSPINAIRIGEAASGVRTSLFDGVVEHAAIWSRALTSTEATALRTLASAPTDIDDLVDHLSFKNSLNGTGGILTWTAEDLAAPSYTDLGIEYGSVDYSLTYDGNGETGGSSPIDGNSPYSLGSAVNVLGNAGSLVRDNHTWAGWNTAVDGTGTHYDAGDSFEIEGNTVLYAEWVAAFQYRTIDHRNYDPALRTDAEIAAAALLQVYYEHASTGQDIVGESDVDSSSGINYNGSGNCGLALLHAVDPRYICNRDSHVSGNDPTWFSNHVGLQTNARGNPTPVQKRSDFTAMSEAMRAALSSGGVAMWKYCWIDVWPSTSGYISDGAVAAAADISAIEDFEAANPGVTVVWWTMPLQSTESYQAREEYNNTIRTYCLDQGKWLIDMAALECHNDQGEKQTDVNGREIAVSTYVTADGGHLSEIGREKLAKAYWSMMAAIANDVNTAVYEVSGITYDESGAVLGGCILSVFKHLGEGEYEYIGTGMSDMVTGDYSLIVPDGDAAYMVVAFRSDDPHVYDVTDNNLSPDLVL